MSPHRLLILPMILTGMSIEATAQTIPTDREGLEKGEGMGMGLYGEIHGYPRPKHVLEMKDTLKLSSHQVKKAESIFDEMNRQATSLGKSIISMEEKLNDYFHSGKVSEDSVLVMSASIGQLRGQLRAVHLRAHLLTREVLAEEQLSLYMHLRGHAGHGHH